jgi:hypothetical protein
MMSHEAISIALHAAISSSEMRRIAKSSDIDLGGVPDVENAAADHMRRHGFDTLRDDLFLAVG